MYSVDNHRTVPCASILTGIDLLPEGTDVNVRHSIFDGSHLGVGFGVDAGS